MKQQPTTGLDFKLQEMAQRIRDLREKCEKKGLDFDIENEKYLAKKAEKERRKEEKVRKKAQKRKKA